jgi:hypothetical protein
VVVEEEDTWKVAAVLVIVEEEDNWKVVAVLVVVGEDDNWKVVAVLVVVEEEDNNDDVDDNFVCFSKNEQSKWQNLTRNLNKFFTNERLLDPNELKKRLDFAENDSVQCEYMCNIFLLYFYSVLSAFYIHSKGNFLHQII